MFGFPKWIIAGSIGGAVGAAVWAAISYFANAEVGYIAWGIGFIVGFFVRVAAGENENGMAPGLTAAIVAIVAVLGGKYAGAYMLASSDAAEISAITFSAEDAIISLADELVVQREAKGQQVAFPDGKTIDDAMEQGDYPPDIWNEATAAWTKLSAHEQQKKIEDFKQQHQQRLKSLGIGNHEQTFLASFGLFDLLWFFLAAGTAYRLGAGDDESQAMAPAASA